MSKGRKFASLSGQIDVKFTLNPDGTVKETSDRLFEFEKPTGGKVRPATTDGTQV